MLFTTHNVRLVFGPPLTNKHTHIHILLCYAMLCTTHDVSISPIVLSLCPELAMGISCVRACVYMCVCVCLFLCVKDLVSAHTDGTLHYFILYTLSLSYHTSIWIWFAHVVVFSSWEITHHVQYILLSHYSLSLSPSLSTMTCDSSFSPDSPHIVIWWRVRRRMSECVRV